MSDKWKNASGTFNGAQMLSDLSGLSLAEVKWTFDRLKQLMTVDGKSKEESREIVAEEAKSEPWKVQS